MATERLDDIIFCLLTEGRRGDIAKFVKLGRGGPGVELSHGSGPRWYVGRAWNWGSPDVLKDSCPQGLPALLLLKHLDFEHSCIFKTPSISCPASPRQAELVFASIAINLNITFDTCHAVLVWRPPSSYSRETLVIPETELARRPLQSLSLTGTRCQALVPKARSTLSSRPPCA
jgi:hypothetical protein